MGNIGVTEILLIAVVALLLFGAGRIADIGKGLGQGIKNFKQGLKEAEELDAKKRSRKITLEARILQAGVDWSRSKFYVISLCLAIFAMLLTWLVAWVMHSLVFRWISPAAPSRTRDMEERAGAP